MRLPRCLTGRISPPAQSTGRRDHSNASIRNVNLERIHERRVAECEDASQTLLRDRRADLPRRRSDHSGGFACERVHAVGTARPIDGIFQSARDRALVLPSDEEHRIRRRDSVLEFDRNRRVVRVIDVAVERQVLNGISVIVSSGAASLTSACARERLMDLVARLPTKYPTLKPAI
jgi:hypothetical protein